MTLFFSYKERQYFLEREDKCHILYKVSSDMTEAKLIEKIEGEDLIVRVNNFLNSVLLDKKSFNQLYSNIDIIDIE
ncbi:MAG: hypothetical protein ACI4M5_05525 [Christensenellales bacterium]